MSAQVFLPDEGHTLACLIRATLRSTSDRSIVSCVVQDDMVDAPGLMVRAESVQDILCAIDANITWLGQLEASLNLPTLRSPSSASA